MCKMLRDETTDKDKLKPFEKSKVEKTKCKSMILKALLLQGVPRGAGGKKAEIMSTNRTRMESRFIVLNQEHCIMFTINDHDNFA